MPCSFNGVDDRNGWGATIVDGLSTLLIADMQPEVFNALNYTVNIDFTSPDGLVDPFETIIRYLRPSDHFPLNSFPFLTNKSILSRLARICFSSPSPFSFQSINCSDHGRCLGGILSTVDLLEHGFGPGGHQTPFDPKGLQVIRRQAEILVHKLAPGLNSPMKMWLPRVDFRTGRGVQEDLWGDTAISPARAGTNILEYGRLSELSRDLVYFRNVMSQRPQKTKKKPHSYSDAF